jgi:Tfp pilus assembly protein PilF
MESALEAKEKEPAQAGTVETETPKPEMSPKHSKEQESALMLERNGMRLMEYRRFDEALDYFRDAAHILRRINDQDNLGRIYFRQGECMESQQKMSDALGFFRESRECFRKIDDKSRYGSASDRLAKVHYWQGKIEDAIAEYEDAISYGTLGSEIFNNQAFLLIENGEMDRARERLEKALELRDQEKSTETHITYNNLGIIEFLAGNHQKAADYFQKGIEKDTRPPEDDRSIQFVVFAKPRFRDEEFETYGVFKDVNTAACLMLNLAASAEALGDKALADQMLAKALEIDGDYPHTHEAHGWILLGRGDEAKALEHFRKALPYDSANEDLRQVIGMINPYLSSKAGRNDPCPCGSGKKFKKCHGS